MSNNIKNPDLKLIHNSTEEESLEEAAPMEALKKMSPRSYWNTCGATQDSFPCQVCPEEEVAGEGWSVKSKEHNNCFWEWVRSRTYPDGFMNPLSQAKTAKLLGISPTSVHLIEKSALKKLKEGPYLEILREYLTSTPETEALDEYSHTIKDPGEEDS